MSASHSKAPWHAMPTHLGAAFDIGGADGGNVALVYADKDEDEGRLNARLIAVAPELLAALQNSVCAMECALHLAGEHIAPFDRKIEATIKAARAAIAKAETTL